jgi:hypothetical protein
MIVFMHVSILRVNTMITEVRYAIGNSNPGFGQAQIMEGV